MVEKAAIKQKMSNNQMASMLHQPHFSALETAFLQFSFAIKIWNYLLSHEENPGEYPFNSDAFDLNLVAKDQIGQIACPNKEFNTFEEIINAAANNISICFGAAAITLWEAIREKNGYGQQKMPDPSKSDKEHLAALSYMIRCCFAHGTAVPSWKIDNAKYKIIYQVGNKKINLESSDQKAFDYPDIGGPETLKHIRMEAESIGMI
jgi:hypothetical protein